MVGRREHETLAEYQTRFRASFAAIIEGVCPTCGGRLDPHVHDGETWGCCASCAFAYRARTATEDSPVARAGEPVITSTGTPLWHRGPDK